MYTASAIKSKPMEVMVASDHNKNHVWELYGSHTETRV